MRVQRVEMPDGAQSWTVLDEQGDVIKPAEQFLAYLSGVGRSPGTVRSYAFDLRDFFEFLSARELDWANVQLEQLSWFVGWLRVPREKRTRDVVGIATVEGGCGAATINRKLAALGSFYRFHHRHGVDCVQLLTTLSPGGNRGSWRPFLAHLGTDQRRRTLKLATPRTLPTTLSDTEIATISRACLRLRDRFFIELLAGSGLRSGEALGLRHEDIDPARSLVTVVSRTNANGARVKGGQRQVPISGPLVRLYSDYLLTEYRDLTATMCSSTCGAVTVVLPGAIGTLPISSVA